tara:strand:- start:501 stop:1526 length:1026 start_codon:yes stop_codon:yes gene_type:complete
MADADDATQDPITDPAAADAAKAAEAFDKSFDEFASAPVEDQAGDEADPDPEPKKEPDADAGADPAAAAEDGSPDKGDVAAKEPDPKPDDIWEGATDAQKAAFETAEAGNHKFKSNEGRAAADARRIASLESDLAAATASPEADGGEGDLAETFAGDDWKQVENELPEVAGPLKNILTGLNQRNSALTKELATFSDERRDQVAETQIGIVLGVHPDWDAVTADPKFGEWASKEPHYVQAMVSRNADRIKDGEEAAHVVSLYKASDGYVPPVTDEPAAGMGDSSAAEPESEPAGEPNKRDRANERRLKSSTSAPSKGPGSPSGPPDEFDEAFDHFARQEQAA